MEEFQIEHPDSKLLWLVWVLMREFEKAKTEKRKNRHGINFFHLPPVYGMKYFYDVDSLYKVLGNYLCERDGVIKEMFVGLYEPVIGEDPTSYSIGSMHFQYGKAISENDREALNHYDLHGYDINLDYARAKAFITSYISKWQEEEFEHPTQNLLEFTEQRNRVIEEIYQLLEKRYIKRKLHISFDFDVKDCSAEVDFIAILLSLEQSEYLKITGIKPTQKDPLVKNKITWEAVVNLKEKFYLAHPSVDLSISARENPDLSKMEAGRVHKSKSKIMFNEHGEVMYGKKHLGSLNPGTPDYYLFQCLYDAGNKAVDYEVLATYVGKKLYNKPAVKVGKTYDNYCQAIKNSINNYAPSIAKLIEKRKTPDIKKGYRIRIIKNGKNL